MHDESAPDSFPFRAAELIRSIPKGKVATYGQIAQLAGIPGHARQVGYALHNLPDGSGVPWHRVINQKGQISFISDIFARSLQRELLESEGIVFDSDGVIALEKYQW